MGTIKRPRGRPTKYTASLAAELLERLGGGETLQSICRDDGMPEVRSVNRWTDDPPPTGVPASFASEFAQARARGFDAIAADSIEIIDTKPAIVRSVNGNHRDSAHVAWLKNRAEHRLKLLAKWDPKRYGEKLGIEHSGTISTAERMKRAEERLGDDDGK